MVGRAAVDLGFIQPSTSYHSETHRVHLYLTPRTLAEDALPSGLALREALADTLDNPPCPLRADDIEVIENESPVITNSTAPRDPDMPTDSELGWCSTHLYDVIDTAVELGLLEAGPRPFDGESALENFVDQWQNQAVDDYYRACLVTFRNQ
jgi:hypothetical protein